MQWTEDQMEWAADGALLRVGLTRFGSGPALLLLPALSSISTRGEMRPLQERLGASFSTIAVDWPGFGDLPRPRVNWRPALYRDFLRFLLAEIGALRITVAAGHAAGYVLAEAADNPASTGALCLLSPTWRGPFPTMIGGRNALFRVLAKAVDLPIAGSGLYRLNVNSFVISMMTRGHVYSDVSWMTCERAAAKRAVTNSEGARYASFRFVLGELDLFTEREAFLAAARRVSSRIVLVYASGAPRKSKHEMAALASLENVSATVIPCGKLSFYEEFPDQTAGAILTAFEY